MKMFDDAHAIYEEFAVDVDNPVEWFFIADVEDDGTETLSIDDQTNKWKQHWLLVALDL